MASGNPLALGLILSAIRYHDDGRLDDLVELYPIRLTADEVLDDIRAAGRPGVLFVSNYLWTIDANLDLARRVKELSADTLIVFGGPSAPAYPDRVERFLSDHPYVDLLAHGEGEVTAVELVETWTTPLHDGGASLAGVAGLSYRSGATVVRTADRERLPDLNVIPSPYLAGFFDHLASTPMVWALETNRGCPYGCTFCDWGAATRSRIRKFDLDRVKAEFIWLAERGMDSVFVTDANFGIFERDIEIAMHVADLRQRLGAPRSLILTFAKNTVKYTLEITRILQDAGLATEATIAFQTTDDATLLNIRRKNVKPDTYQRLADEARRLRLPVLADLMVGLPGMTMATFKTDLQTCYEQDVSARVFTTLVLENSPMNEPEYRRTHQIETDEFEQVIATSTFTSATREEIVLFRNAFRFADHFGALRYVLRFVAHETEQREIDVFDDLYHEVLDRRAAFPVLTFAFTHARRYLTPTLGWPALLAEARTLLIGQHGINPDRGLDAMLAAQEALLPTPGRTYPHTVKLCFDVVTYLHQFLRQQEQGPHRRLCTYPPGWLTVSDPAAVSESGIEQPRPPILDSKGWSYLFNEYGWNEENNWELESPLARSIRSGRYS